MELIDTHCHLTFEQLAGDIENVLERSKSAGVTGWITVGTDSEHNRKVVQELTPIFLYGIMGKPRRGAKNIGEG